jgi:hypothetical protein
MAVTELRAESACDNSAIVAALLRALQMDKDADDATPDDPDAQLAWAAFTGAKTRTMECGIGSANHAAAAALLAFDEIENVIDGCAVHRENRKVIDYADAERELRIVRKALLGIWEYIGRQDPKVRVELKPLAEYCGANRF